MNRSIFIRGNAARVFVMLVLVIGLAGLPFRPAHAASLRYVRQDGAGDCSSWANACDLQTALDDASSDDDIWVAAGIYKPGSDPEDTFQLVDGVDVLGGFPAAGNPELDERDPSANVTILSGDIDNNDTNDDGNNIDETYGDIAGNNSYHVVTGESGATLDGFVVTGGNAHGSVDYQNFGGGMLNMWYKTPTVTHMVFSGNSADEGGGMYNGGSSSPTVTDATFSGN